MTIATPQMDVLYLTLTGHVLGIFTRTSEPAQIEADATAFVGIDGFRLRGFGDQTSFNYFNNQEFVIPESQIGLLRADLNPSQVIAPRQYQVTLPVSSPASIQNLSGSLTTFSYVAGSFTIVPAPGATVQYMILIYGPTPTAGPGSPIQTLQKNNVTAPGLMTGKQYFAIAFVAGQEIAVTSFTAA